MLRQLIRASIDHAAVVCLLAMLLVGVAAYRLPKAPVDVFPELNAPTVVVMAESGGLASDEVEQFVTLPLESAFSGIPGVQRTRASSAMGLSMVYVEFPWGMDTWRARQLVSERLDSVREVLPEEAHAEMTAVTSLTGEILLLALRSPDGSKSPMELRDYAEFDLSRRLLAVPGVAQVSVIGGELPEYQVLCDPERLRGFGLSVEDVAEAAAEAHGTRTAGYLADVEGLEVPLRGRARVRSVGDLKVAPVVERDGRTLTLEDVAEVRLGPAPSRGAGSSGGLPAVILTVQKSPGTNTLKVTEQIDRTLDSLGTAIPRGMALELDLFRQADFIGRAVDGVTDALIDAAIIVSVLLALFLMNLRTTLITLTALPLSLAAGWLVLEWMGETINVMTLGGLAIAVGSLVDDAIIDVENVLRRLRQNATLPESERRGRLDVIFEASNEIRPAMVFATGVIALCFLPLLFLEGIEGRMFRPLGIAFLVSLAASLLVALTVTPALCRALLRGEFTERDAPLARFLKRAYAPILEAALRFKKFLIAGAAAATVGAILLARTFGTSFLPEFNEGVFTVGLFAPPGTSLVASERMAGTVEERFMEVEGVKSVTRRTGRAERDEHTEPVSASEIDVTLDPGADRERVREDLEHILGSVPGITTNVGQPIEHRLSHILSGTPAAIAIKVFGEDLDVLRELAGEIESSLADLPDVRDVKANREVLVRSVPIDYDRAALARYGLSPASAAEQVGTQLHGKAVARIHDGPKRHDLVVRLVDEARDDLEDVKRLVLRGAGGALVRLEEVAEVGGEWTSNLILREDGQRKSVVSLNVAGGANLGHLVDDVRARVDPIVARRGYRVEYGGQFEAQRSAQRALGLFGAAVIAGMGLLLVLATGSWRAALLVLLNLPLAMIGGVLAVFLTSGNPVELLRGAAYQAPVLSVASLVGFITLFGVAVRGGILLVNHFAHLREHEGCDLAEAIRRGSSERLLPILMTALTAALALIPIVLQGDRPGNELLSPLSVVILGGLITSTFLNLIVVPAAYAWTHSE